ncbi:MAG: pantetheine-phosphate adenylyltransferase [Planctomycetes bacterium]|nr:pantetheine-phosphate adenylyltransferase [Planctomycetota bacterium]
MSERARGHHALFPGSFDPPTLGHLDLVRRAQTLFGRVSIAVARNPEKAGLFTSAERVQLFRGAVVGLAGVEVLEIDGLVVEAARSLGCDVIVRGVRSGTDFDYEISMARTNRALYAAADTVLLAPPPEYAHISASLVRQIARMGGDVSSFVPANVLHALEERCGRS